jgi:hypothetical protein
MAPLSTGRYRVTIGTDPRPRLAGWLLVLSLFLVLFVRRQWRAIAFALVFCIVLWLQMALTEQGGTGTHHTVLLWPAPTFVVAAVLGGVANRLSGGAAIAAIAVGITCISNLLVTGTHYTKLIQRGAVIEWTDALWPAIAEIKKNDPAEIAVLDWGFFDNLRLMFRGRIRLSNINVAGGINEVSYARSRLTESGVLFISHTPGNDIDAGSLKRFLDFLAAEGFQPADVRIFNDPNGRPTIQVFRVQRKQS